MADQPRIFVGREQELAALKQAIARPEGQLILVIGGEGRGKTALLEELNRQLTSDPSRFSLHYQLNRNDTSDAFLDRLMGVFLRIGGLTKGRLVLGAPGQEKKWHDFLGAAGKLEDIPFLGEAAKKITCLADFLKILIPDDKRPSREKFIDFLRLTAKRLGDKRRLVLLLDPEKYLDESVAEDCQSLVRHLPDGVAMVFAQRPDDCLAQSDLIVADKVSRIPETPLGHLPRDKSDQLIAEGWHQKDGWMKLAAEPPAQLCQVLWDKYEGWPLPLTIVLRDLPQEPEGLDHLVAAAQEMPERMRDLLSLRYGKAVAEGDDAVRLLHGLAILEWPATAERVAALCGEGCTAAGLSAAAHQPAVAKCMSMGEKGLLSLFHATMGECVLTQMSEDAKQDLHGRAAKLYEADLKKNKSDREALHWLPYHAYHGSDERAFLDAAERVGQEKHRLWMLRSCERDLRWALLVYRRLAKAEPAAFGHRVAVTLNNLGIVLTKLQEKQAARKAFEKALDIYRRLAKHKPAAFEPDVAGTLRNLGSVLSELQEKQAARKAFDKALDIYRRLAKHKPAAFEADLALTLNNLGNVLRDLHERHKARETYEQALEIRRRLAEDQPAAFEPDVAMTLNNLGIVLSELRETEEARKAHEDALEIRRRLAEQQPAAFEPDVAVTLSNLGIVLRALGEREQARKAYEGALEIRRKLAKAEPAAFEPGVAMTLNNLGNVLRDLRERAQARQAFDEALKIYTRYAKAEPAAFLPHVAATLTNLGLLLLDVGERAQARQAFDEALKIYTRYAKAEPTAFVGYLITVVGSSLKLVAETGEKPTEWPALMEAMKLLDQLRRAEEDRKQDES